MNTLNLELCVHTVKRPGGKWALEIKKVISDENQVNELVRAVMNDYDVNAKIIIQNKLLMCVRLKELGLIKDARLNESGLIK